MNDHDAGPAGPYDDTTGCDRRTGLARDPRWQTVQAAIERHTFGLLVTIELGPIGATTRVAHAEIATDPGCLTAALEWLVDEIDDVLDTFLAWTPDEPNASPTDDTLTTRTRHPVVTRSEPNTSSPDDTFPCG